MSERIQLNCPICKSFLMCEHKMNEKKLIEEIQKCLRDHKKVVREDGEAYSDCPKVEEGLYEIISDSYEIDGNGNQRVVPLKEAKKQQKEMLENIGCSFCELCSFLIKELKK